MFNKDVIKEVNSLYDLVYNNMVETNTNNTKTINTQRGQIDELQRLLAKRETEIAEMKTVVHDMQEQQERDKEVKGYIDEMLTTVDELKSMLLQTDSQAISDKSRIDELVYDNNNLSNSLAESNTSIVELKTKLDGYIKAYDELGKQKRKDDVLLEELKSYAKKSNLNQDELHACLSAVLSGMFDHDHIEFVALKTYRGWKYIYHDGKTIDDFDNVSGIDVIYRKGDKVELNVCYE